MTTTKPTDNAPEFVPMTAHSVTCAARSRVTKAVNTVVFALLFIGLVFMATTGTAQAQANKLPGFSVPSMPSEGLALDNLNRSMFSTYETAFHRLKNPLMADTMLLQYQISLLKIMIKRQGEIDNISRSYEKLGISFKQPAPEKTTCERLPENLLCILFYPESFDIDVSKYTDPAPLTGLDFMAMPAEPVTPAQNKVDAPKKPEKPAKPVEEEIKSSYQWADIQCAGKMCRAVLLDSAKSGHRMTVRMGEVLPDESVVQDISYTGVRLNKKGKSLELDPAPTNPIAVSDGQGFGEIGDLLRGSGISTESSGSTPSNLTAEPITAEPSSPFSNDPAPVTSEPAAAPANEPAMLGPTGLF